MDNGDKLKNKMRSVLAQIVESTEDQNYYKQEEAVIETLARSLIKYTYKKKIHAL